MFWPFVLPLQLTLVGVLLIFVAIHFVGRKRKWLASTTAIVAIVSVPVSFPPMFMAVSISVDYLRFGMFHYENYGDIQDFRVERYMPSTATNIDVFKNRSGNGYRAMFSISKEQLTAFQNDMWGRYGKISQKDRPADDMLSSYDSAEFERYFGQFEWRQPKDLVQYSGPVAANGAHYTMAFSAAENLAFLVGCYW